MDEENDKDTYNEIKELNSKLDKVLKENENLKKFNEDLRNQVSSSWFQPNKKTNKLISRMNLIS